MISRCHRRMPTGLRSVRGVGPRVYRLLLEKVHDSGEGVRRGCRANCSSRRAAIGRRRILPTFAISILPRRGCANCRGSAHTWSSGSIPSIRRACARSRIGCVPVCAWRRAARDAQLHRDRWRPAPPAKPGGGWQQLGMELAAKDFAVVSGLARGGDGELTAARSTRAAQRSRSWMRYRRDLPSRESTARAEIVEKGGALISELPVGTQPLAENFPTRNRILSGLCLDLDVVIVEAAERRGSFITARLVLEQDRQVFAVPTSPLSGKARGSNRLLKEGAKQVECVEDVIEELGPPTRDEAGGRRSASAYGIEGRRRGYEGGVGYVGNFRGK